MAKMKGMVVPKAAGEFEIQEREIPHRVRGGPDQSAGVPNLTQRHDKYLFSTTAALRR